MWRVSIGDLPIRMPATNAPSTVLTPMSCVVSAIAAMMIRIVVMTGKSLLKLSFAHRIKRNTIRRPTVKLATMKSPVPSTARLTDHTSIVPAAARPNATAMIATIFTEEMESAVPRKIEVTRRVSGRGRNSAGKNSPSAKPQANGMATPASAAAIAAADAPHPALLAPEPDQGGLVITHDDPGVGAADKEAAVYSVDFELCEMIWHDDPSALVLTLDCGISTCDNSTIQCL